MRRELSKILLHEELVLKNITSVSTERKGLLGKNNCKCITAGEKKRYRKHKKMWLYMRS